MGKLNPYERKLLKYAEIIRTENINLALGANPKSPEMQARFASMPKDALDTIARIEDDLMHRFYAYQYSHGMCWKYPEDLQEYNTIDITDWWDFMEGEPISDGAKPYEDQLKLLKRPEMNFYFTLPVYSEGVIKSKNGFTAYYKVTNLDESTKSYSLFVQSFTAGSGVSWCNDTMASATISYSDTFTDKQIIIDDDCPDHNTSYLNLSSVTPSKLGFTYFETQLWTQIVNTELKIQDKIQSDVIARLPTDVKQQLTMMETLLDEVTQLFVAINFALFDHKQPVAAKRNKPEHPSVSVTTSSQSKRVRYVNTLSFTSIKAPRIVNSKTIRHYSVSSWETRSHFRKLKSGKIVPVRASVHHRRSIQDCENIEPGKVTYKMK